MCLSIKKLSFKRKALKNIVVYKQLSSYVIDGVTYYKTPYRESPIEMGGVYESNLTRFGNSIEEGLHSFTDPLSCFSISPWYNGNYHYLNGKTYEIKPVLVKCVIPKGARYYKGTFDTDHVSMASNKLRYIKEIRFRD